MAKIVKQFRFYSDENAGKNQPNDVNSTGCFILIMHQIQLL